MARRIDIAKMVVGAAVALLALDAAAGPDTVKLKSEALVKGPKVLLSDVAEVQGDNADAIKAVELALAPQPGASARIDAAVVNARLHMAGIQSDAVQVTGAPSVRTTTMSLAVTPDMLREDLRRFIETQMPWSPQDANIDVDVPGQELIVPDGNIEFKWRPSPQYGYIGPGAFRGEVRVDGTLKKTLLCKATVEAYGDVVVASRDIAAGKPVGPADVTIEKRLLTGASQGFAQKPADVVGSVARASVYTGQPVLPRNLMPRTLIKRGQLVPVQVKSGGLTLRSLAKAKTDAREGDILVCINPDSKEEFQGVVGKDGTLTVE